MQLSRLLLLTALLLAPVALVGTTWLYLYPFFDRACNFPKPPSSASSLVAPFRLLALGDPQLEGDSSLPKPGAPIFPSLQFLVNDVRNAGSFERGVYLVKDGLRGVPKDFWKWLKSHRKRIDLWGNDWYLAHIVRTLRWWSEPSHVAVLGDLLGSQWISDEEFERRRKRYWDIVFKGMEKVPEGVMVGEENGESKKWGGTLEILGDDKRWEDRVINIAGNHDIGYAGDIDEKRIERFEKAFGKVNWDIVFTLPKSLQSNGTTDDSASESETEDFKDAPALRLVILNSMNLDTPAYTESLQRESYDFMNHVITTSRPVTDKTHTTILLTHIPLYKESGVCVDSPYFNFFDTGSGVKEQNMLSDYVSKMMLEGIFGLNSNYNAPGQGFGRRGIVINGHDHEGCDVLHYIPQPDAPSQCPQDIEIEDIHMPKIVSNVSEASSADDSISETDLANGTNTEPEQASQEPQPPTWQALHYPHLPYKATKDGECISLNHVPRIREVTLRSMMGDFSGHAGFLSAWFDTSLGEKGEWKMEISTCGLGVQHWWWGVHIIDLILVVFAGAGLVAVVIERTAEQQRGERKEREKLAGGDRIREKQKIVVDAHGKKGKGIQTNGYLAGGKSDRKRRG